MSVSATRCVILAAGMSSRLRPLTDELPKCLLSIAGKTILERMVESILHAGVLEIALVIGFHARKIRSHLLEKFPQMRFRFILNPNFSTTNNAYSLWLARSFLEGSRTKSSPRDRLLLLDADIVFHPFILSLILGADGANKLAVRMQGEHDEEEVHVGIDASGRVTGIGKGAVSGVTIGESVGIELFSNAAARLLFEVLEHRVKTRVGRKEFYEASFDELIARGTKIEAVDVGRTPVMEIDSAEDFERASQLIVPNIDETSHV